MFGIIHYEMFLAASIILNMTPGSDTIYVLSRSIAQGPNTGSATAQHKCCSLSIPTGYPVARNKSPHG